MYIRYKVLRILAYSSPILPNNLGWSNPANRTTKTHLNWPRVRLVTSLLHITSNNDRSSARADIDPNLDVSSVFSRKRGGCRAASWPWFSSARNSYHVCIYIYIFPDVLFPSLLSRPRFFERRKMRKTRSRVGYTAVFSVYEKSAQHKSAGVSTHEGRCGLWGFAVGRSRNYTVKRGTKGRTVRTSVEKFYGAACARGWGARVRFNIN